MTTTESPLSYGVTIVKHDRRLPTTTTGMRPLKFKNVCLIGYTKTVIKNLLFQATLATCGKKNRNFLVAVIL